MIWKKILYGALFVVVLPTLLVVWAGAARANVSMPLYGNTALGGVFAALGLTLILTGMWELWRLGSGLPMNAFPPARLVSQGMYCFIPHPIYTGFVGVCLGVAMMARSASGLWLVTPCVVLGCAALVLGYEHVDLSRRFGGTLRILPADELAAPSNPERVRFLLLVVVPWLALYEFTIRLPLPGTPVCFGFENRLPILPWTTVLYESIYVAVILAPWCARTRRDLRKLMVSGWVAAAVVFPFYWFVPTGTLCPPLSGDGLSTRLLGFERAMDAPVAALPSFHVLWAVFVARLYRPRWVGACFVAIIAVTCVTTRMHYIPDVMVALAIAPVLLEPQRAWEMLRRAAEWFANSWREWRVGAVRVINHGVYAGAAAAVQMAIVAAAMGRGQEWKAFVTGLAGLVGAGAWAQWVEGSSRLRRPFGFYGGLIGVVLACLCFRERWPLLAAHALGAPWMQAIGRLRCLVNGCCHGRPAEAAVGIRVSHPRSRVAQLAELRDVPIHPTQLYSILGNVFLGLLLARLWISHCPLVLVGGVYAIGNGMARFIEEAYRGEPQTPVVAGLRLYQWLAVGTVAFGAVLTSLGSLAPPSLDFTPHCLVLALAFGCLAAAAMGVDLPESDRTLARLT
jgi:protein-S-isoprenylcysteine O-methyltransferase Ste14